MLGYMAIPRIDYSESFSPFVTDATTRIMIVIYLHEENKKWTIKMINFKAAFFNANIS